MMISVSTTFCSASMPVLGLPHPLGAFELEGLGHDADGQNAKFARRLGDDRGRAGPGAAAHAGGDEAHVRAGQMIHDLLDRLLGGGGADRGARTGAETFRDLHAHLDACRRMALLQRLRIGIRHHEFDTFQLLLDHVVHSVAASTAHPEHRDPRLQVLLLIQRQIQCHFIRLSCPRPSFGRLFRISAILGRDFPEVT